MDSLHKPLEGGYQSTEELKTVLILGEYRKYAQEPQCHRWVLIQTGLGTRGYENHKGKKYVTPWI